MSVLPRLTTPPDGNLIIIILEALTTRRTQAPEIFSTTKRSLDKILAQTSIPVSGAGALQYITLGFG